MNYELCKKLKDAGFPLRTTDWQMVGRETIYFLDGNGLDESSNRTGYISPTLSELIEACGENCMVWGNNAGIVYDVSPGTITYDIYESGKTKEEAVANLWLELNK